MKFLNRIIVVILLMGMFVTGVELVQANEGEKQAVPLLNLWNYVFVEKYSNEDMSYYEYENSGEKIELNVIKGVEKDVADVLISDKVFVFQSLFELKRTGYPGQFTKYIECPEEYKPKFYNEQIEGGSLKYFIGFSNSNYVGPACSEDLIKYKSLFGLLYCRDTKTMYEIDYFTSLESPEKITLFLGLQIGKQEELIGMLNITICLMV